MKNSVLFSSGQIQHYCIVLKMDSPNFFLQSRFNWTSVACATQAVLRENSIIFVYSALMFLYFPFQV